MQTNEMPSAPLNIAPQENWGTDTEDISLDEYDTTAPMPGVAATPDMPEDADGSTTLPPSPISSPANTIAPPPPPPADDDDDDDDEDESTHIFGRGSQASGPETATHGVQRQELPVAVLVVTGGAMKGALLPVKAGNSSLGRSRKNRIVMEADPYVSHEHHIDITHYADAEDIFMVSLGKDCSGVAYLNDAPLNQPVPLKQGDRIRLTSRRGNDNPTELLFLPICGEHGGRTFSW